MNLASIGIASTEFGPTTILQTRGMVAIQRVAHTTSPALRTLPHRAASMSWHLRTSISLECGGQNAQYSSHRSESQQQNWVTQPSSRPVGWWNMIHGSLRRHPHIAPPDLFRCSMADAASLRGQSTDARRVHGRSLRFRGRNVRTLSGIKSTPIRCTTNLWRIRYEATTTGSQWTRYARKAAATARRPLICACRRVWIDRLQAVPGPDPRSSLASTPPNSE